MNSPTELEFTVQEVAELLKSENPPRLLDTREQSEWEIAHLEGGQLVTEALFNEVLNQWDRETPIVCYCHHGIRSMQTATFLRRQGFTNVRSMKGGLDVWAQEIDSSMDRY